MVATVIATFVIGYAAIVFEHPLKIDKTVPALLMGVILWAMIAVVPSLEHMLVHVGVDELYAHEHGATKALSHHLAEIAEILLFLMGAMTIVELVDIHKGFSVITNRIRTKSSVRLLWMVSFIAFFMSAVLDNLTATIIMVSLMRKLIKDDEQRRYFIGILVIAANAGGAWSPIGDVTTTMLWIGHQVTTIELIRQLLIPSLVCLVVPLMIATWSIKRSKVEGAQQLDMLDAMDEERVQGSRLMLFLGVTLLIFVPIFKTITHLPPYVGMLFGLGVLWMVSEIIHREKDHDEKAHFSAIHALSKIDMASILFFLGILMAVGALQSLGLLKDLAVALSQVMPGKEALVLALGVGSAIIDNVPLVAAAMGMFDITSPEALAAASGDELANLAYFTTDGKFWSFLAYCAGTGGSMLIIGSAAGVAAMGMERIDFVWYVKKISLLATAGYIAGAVTYLFMAKFILGM